MLQWVRKGLTTGIKTTGYPDRAETAPGVSPGFPTPGDYPTEQVEALIDVCPTGALTGVEGRIAVDPRRCVHCFRCQRAATTPLAWQPGWEWAAGTQPALDKAFRRAASVLVVDAGDCGACLHEVKQLNNPYYNMHRLGIFMTPTPRHADLLLVVGPVTDAMRVALRKTYEAMPTPRRVVAVGACALSGGVFEPGFVCEGGVASVLPVDVEVPGHPPPPLAILHGLLVALGRKPAADWDITGEEVAP